MLKHPEQVDLDDFLRSLDTGSAGLLLHFLSCDDCASHALETLLPLEHRRGLLALRRSLPEIDYSHVWERVEAMSQKALELLRRERAEAEPLLAELLRLPQEKRLELVRGKPRFRSWALADLLLEEARLRLDLREDLARLVLAIVEAGPGRHAARDAGDLAAAAYCEIAESLRARGDLAAAEAAFGQAAEQLRSSAATLARANFCHLLAGLRRDQGRADEALGLLDRAADLLEEAGNHQARAAALVEYGFLALEGGEPERALAAFDDATARARNLSADLAFRAVQGIGMALAQQGKLAEALATMAEARFLYGWTHETPESLRLLALEGRLALSLGQDREAMDLLATAFNGLAGRGDALGACSAAIDLGRALLLVGRPRKELRQLARRLQPLLGAPELPEEVRSALTAFARAAAGTAPVDLQRLRELASLLESCKPAEGSPAKP